MQKLIIEAALNETVTRAANRQVPLTPEEIAADAQRCFDAGASIVHFHPRDPATPEGELDIRLLADAPMYARTMRLIKRQCGAICYPSSPYFNSAEGELYPHVRALREDKEVRLETFVFFVGAVNTGVWLPQKQKFVNDRVDHLPHGRAASFLGWCRESGLKPQFGVREPGHVRHVYAYQQLGLVHDPVVLHLNFSDTNPVGPLPDARGIHAFLDAAPAGKPPEWFMHIFSNKSKPGEAAPESHRRLNMLAIAMGGHVRTGIGDLPRWDEEEPSNAQMVERFARMARDIGREIASPDEARQILGLGRH